MLKMRRTIRRYVELFRNPKALFGVTPNGAVNTILFPNGERAIWFSTDDGLGFAVTVGEGPAGLSIRVRRFVGTPPITLSDGQVVDGTPQEDAEWSLCQYRQDGRSQAFKRWYLGLETPEDVTLLGKEYDRRRQQAS